MAIKRRDTRENVRRETRPGGIECPDRTLDPKYNREERRKRRNGQPGLIISACRVCGSEVGLTRTLTLTLHQNEKKSLSD